MDLLQVVTDARKLITDRSNWTAYTFARDSQGVSVKIKSKEASCYCAAGALVRVAAPKTFVNDQHPIFLLFKTVTGEQLDVFNDSHTHSEVLAAFDQVIQKLATPMESIC